MAAALVFFVYDATVSEGGLGSRSQFPASGAFHVKRAQASGGTGTLNLSAGAINTIVTLHGPNAEPVFIGFVRAGDRASFAVPIGIWRVVIRETPIWDGTSDPEGITHDGPEVQSITVLGGSVVNMELNSTISP